MDQISEIFHELPKAEKKLRMDGKMGREKKGVGGRSNGLLVQVPEKEIPGAVGVCYATPKVRALMEEAVEICRAPRTRRRCQ